MDRHSELDSHADTCVVGKNALIVEDFDRPVNVTSYNKEEGHMRACIMTGALAYNDPKLGESAILIVHQSIHIPTLERNLLCLMQMRLNGVRVSEIPKYLLEQSSNRTHALELREMDTRELYVIPLSLHLLFPYPKAYCG